MKSKSEKKAISLYCLISTFFLASAGGILGFIDDRTTGIIIGILLGVFVGFSLSKLISKSL